MKLYTEKATLVMSASNFHQFCRASAIVVFTLWLVVYYWASRSTSTPKRSRGRSGLVQKKSFTLDRAERVSRARIAIAGGNFRDVCGRHGELVKYVTEKEDFPICVHLPQDMISDRVRKHGFWDDCEDLVWFIWNEFQGGPRNRSAGITSLNIIDVGANIGCCSIRLALLGHKVLSFEPVEANYELFERSVQLNNISSLVTIVKAGASDVHEQRNAIIEAGNAGNSLVLIRREDGQETTGTVEALVRSIPNSTFSRAPIDLELLEPHVLRLGRVDLLKLDCQGCEPAALRGAGRAALDAGRVRNVVAEFSPAHLRAAGEDPAGLLEALSARGFGITTLVTGTRVLPASFGAFAARSGDAPLILHARHAAAITHAPAAAVAALAAAAAAGAGCFLAGWWVWRVRATTSKAD